MNKLIKIFLITFFALVVSCKSNGSPLDEEKVGENPPAGNYTGYGDEVTVTINPDGSCTISGTLYYSPIVSSSQTTRQTITFNVTINTWYTYTGDYHYVKEGSYTVNNITSGYSFDSNDDGVRRISWGYYDGKTLLYIDINGGGNYQLTLN